MAGADGTRFFHRLGILLACLAGTKPTLLLRNLSTDFAARIGRGVDVDVVLAGLEIGGLGVGQRRAAFDRARTCIRDRDRDAGVLAALRGSMEMRGCRGARETGI